MEEEVTDDDEKVKVKKENQVERLKKEVKEIEIIIYKSIQ